MNAGSFVTGRRVVCKLFIVETAEVNGAFAFQILKRQFKGPTGNWQLATKTDNCLPDRCPDSGPPLRRDMGAFDLADFIAAKGSDAPALCNGLPVNQTEEEA